ncbi:Dyp-type peroxidase [Streptomyces sp. 7-21]|uniref:Dyp-type peroxidase n=1 Tax=Streptomyces sp. 7-21 TaxID=2802283 RepID=UPI00191D58ED|nr:Dyp-type peroxidase [Streptomyces sp. 7-21]MBL1067847.1 Dyp-type peroxidase [Streptomyces sp. 7-21]
MVTPTTTETTLPLRTSTDIQGDILAGFRKDHVRLLFLRFAYRGPARDWLRQLTPRIATTADVAAFNYDFSTARRRLRAEPTGLHAVWRGISFTYAGLELLIGGAPLLDLPAGSNREAFAQGPAARGDLLGDTGDSAPENWLFGAPHNEPVHAVLTVAADDAEELEAALAEERQELACSRVSVVFEQSAATLPDSGRGREHFGFKDAVSQPGVEGFDPEDPERPGYVQGKPGTRLIPAGEFLVGRELENRLPGWLPGWMNDGSFHVVRRLGQDVESFWAQADALLEHLKDQGVAPADADSSWLAARLVGRWPSGVPVAASPGADPYPGQTVDDNDISYADDLDGRVTPLFCHTRKTNPRDGLKSRPNDDVALPEDGIVDARRIMRRGVPYGAPYAPASGRPGTASDDERGLLFISYQADLVAQFEFVQRSWAGDENFPLRVPAVGKDPVIGGDTTVSFPAEKLGPDATVPLEMKRFVRTEGAVYAFTPSISTLEALALGTIPPGGGDLPADRVISAPAAFRRGEVVSSGRARLRFEDTGELVVRDENEQLRWSSPTAGMSAIGAEFRETGEIVVTDFTGAVVWQTPTAGNPGATVVVGASGDVSIRSADGRLLWNTGTAH